MPGHKTFRHAGASFFINDPLFLSAERMTASDQVTVSIRRSFLSGDRSHQVIGAGLKMHRSLCSLYFSAKLCSRPLATSMIFMNSSVPISLIVASPVATGPALISIRSGTADDVAGRGGRVDQTLPAGLLGRGKDLHDRGCTGLGDGAHSLLHDIGKAALLVAWGGVGAPVHFPGI